MTKSSGSQLLDSLKEYADKLSPEVAINFFTTQVEALKKKMAEDAAKKAKSYLRATYKVSAVSYTEEVEFTIKGEVTPEVMNEPLALLLDKVIANIEKLEKSNLGVLDITVLISVHRGDSFRNITYLDVSRKWVVDQTIFEQTKKWTTNDYKGM